MAGEAIDGTGVWTFLENVLDRVEGGVKTWFEIERDREEQQLVADYFRLVGRAEASGPSLNDPAPVARPSLGVDPMWLLIGGAGVLAVAYLATRR